MMLKTGIEHYVNPLHVYCRLRDLGVSKATARLACSAYERSIFKCLLLKRHK
ncbi:MAG: hypothetical protein JRJ29_09595 [Deltaproteobacteria bacterium]|nr:hypothetical protein [Deltaproteobacteria bacterium]